MVYRLKYTIETGGRKTPGEASTTHLGGCETPGSSEATRQKLNDDAIKLLLRDVEKETGWEASFRETLAGIKRNRKVTIMEMPLFLKTAKSYQDAYTVARRKGIEEDQKEK